MIAELIGFGTAMSMFVATYLLYNDRPRKATGSTSRFELSTENWVQRTTSPRAAPQHPLSNENGDQVHLRISPHAASPHSWSNENGQEVHLRISKRKFDRQISCDMPVMITLLQLALESGTNIYLSLEAVARHLDGPLANEIQKVVTRVNSGVSLIESLEKTAKRLGSDTFPVIDALIASERYGAPVVGVLEQLALEFRRAQERKAERSLKRLSVKLLFPLAGCTLPAFALLAVVPLIASALTTLATKSF